MTNSEPKYYKPDIEEFHVGFEYQVKWNLHQFIQEQEPHEEIWMKAFVPAPKQINEDWSPLETLGDVYDYIVKELPSGNIRVKYLDIQDILSLGLELVDEIDDNGEATFKWPDNPDWWLNLDGSRVEIGDTDGLVFCGFVKNKSELKRVIKQVKV